MNKIIYNYHQPVEILHSKYRILVDYNKIHNYTVSRHHQLFTFTNAPTTPKLVNLRYSNGLLLLTVWRNGYKNNGI